MEIPWPFVGRAAELAEVEQALTAPTAVGVVVAAAAGLGKTELAEKALAQLDPQRFLVRRIVATADTRTMNFGALSPWLPSSLPAVPVEATLLHEVEVSLAEGLNQRTLVLYIDDAHLLDPMSVVLVRSMVQGRRALLVATVHNGESVQDALESLWRNRIVKPVELRPLPRLDINQVLTQVFGPIEPGLEQRLWDATLGSPLLLREIVVRGEAEGRFHHDGQITTWPGPWDPARLLSGALQARLQRLTREQRLVVHLLAFAGTLGLNLMTRLVSIDAVTSLEIGHHIEIVADDGQRTSIALGHELRRHAAAIRHSVDTLTARAIQRDLAEAIESVGARRHDDALHVSLWRLEAGGAIDPALLLRAARRTLALLDMPTTRRLAEAAVQRDGGNEAAQLLADVLILLGRTNEATAILATLSGQTATQAQLVERVATEAVNLALFSNDPEQATQMLAIVQPTVTEPDARLAVNTMYGLLLILSGRTALGLPVLDDVLKGSEPGQATTLAHLGQTLAYTARGRYHDAQTSLAAGLRSAVHSGQNAAWLQHGLKLAGHFAYAHAADLPKVAELLNETTPEADNPLFPLKDATTLCMRARSAIMHGHAADAVAILHDGLGNTTFLPWLDHMLQCTLAHAAALTGDHLTARQALDKAPPETLAGLRIFSLFHQQATIWITAQHDGTSAAIKYAIDCAARAQANGDHGHELLALHDVVRLGNAQIVTKRLTELAASMDDVPARMYAEHAQAVTAKDGTQLDAIAGSFERLGADLLAAETFAQASIAHHRKGLTASSRHSAARAHKLAARIHPTKTPTLLGYQAPQLTPRELECCQLALQELTNTQIAARLGNDKRTVESHLQRAYTKLGIQGRHQLASVLDF